MNISKERAPLDHLKRLRAMLGDNLAGVFPSGSGFVQTMIRRGICPDFDGGSFLFSVDAAIKLAETVLPHWSWKTGDATNDGLGTWLANTRAATPAIAIVDHVLGALIDEAENMRDERDEGTA